jgi:hypothetical protein
VSETGDLAEATAEIETAFRFQQDTRGRWHISEVRLGQDQWEEIDLMFGAKTRDLREQRCVGAFETLSSGSSNLSVKTARCLIAGLLGVELPSDAVRIRDVSSMGLPLSSAPSSLATALILVDVRFRKDEGRWRAAEIRTGNGAWTGVESVVGVLNDEKRKRAQEELATLARALENFRKDRGFYVVSDKHPVLIDHLSPRYLVQVIRLDPWHKPYMYEGDRDHFSLRSSGPDGKENTGDDIVVSGPSRRPSGL